MQFDNYGQSIDTKKGKLIIKVLTIKIPPKKLACKIFKMFEVWIFNEFAWLLKYFMEILTPQIQREEYN